MNSIISNCGHAAFKAKLQGLEERKQLSSIGCSRTTLRRNARRATMPTFAILAFAAIDMPTSIVQGRLSAELGGSFLSKDAIREARLRPFCERFPVAASGP